MRRAALRCVERFWRDLLFRDLYRSGREFELMQRALGFAALATLTFLPLLILVAAAGTAPHRGLAGWVIYGMGLTGSSADAVTRLFSAPARVLGTTGVFSAVVLCVAGVSFAGSVQGGFERIWGLPAGPWHKIWRQAVWVAGLIGYIYADATVGTVTHAGVAELAGRVAVAVVLGIAFFWWGLRFLVGGRVSYLAAMRGGDAGRPGRSAGLLRPGLPVVDHQERGQLRRARHRPDRAVVADRRRLGPLRRPAVRAVVPRRLAAGLGAEPLGLREA
jgi:membrane protein